MNEYKIELEVIILAEDENEARDIQERIAIEVFEQEEVIQIWTDRIDESNTVTSSSR